LLLLQNKKNNIMFSYIRKTGIRPILRKFLSNYWNPKLKGFHEISHFFKNKNGIEIGGPSFIFSEKGLIPIYPIVDNLDGCNFSNFTIWEGSIEDGKSYKFYENKAGVQFIKEATDLKAIADKKYDFVISTNCLEHMANPLKALEEWSRVLNNEGMLLLILPNKEYTFDHKRKDTSFEHLMDDYRNNTDESDMTHLEEILKLHDLNRDKPSGSFIEFKTRSLKNIENRALHHHVFSLSLMKEIVDYLGLTLQYSHSNKNHIILAQKPS
jgi:SAM-dependent methyltransferase